MVSPATTPEVIKLDESIPSAPSLPTEKQEKVCTLFPTFGSSCHQGVVQSLKDPPPKFLAQLQPDSGNGGKYCAEGKAAFPELSFLCIERGGYPLVSPPALTVAVIACGLLANFLRSFLLITPVTEIIVIVNIY